MAARVRAGDVDGAVAAYMRSIDDAHDDLLATLRTLPSILSASLTG